ncbi:MAG: hypothetical protein EXR75_05155, partial [Myxococcales bacterium]|nr:hypothetical protein [Myxococcales bacterium]
SDGGELLFTVERDGAPVIVTRHVTGTSWTDKLERSRRERRCAKWLETQLRILVQVCAAVELAHAHGLLHLDLRPDHILLGELGDVQLAGWGTATPMEVGTSLALPRAIDFDVARAAAYVAPELANGHALVVGVAADVYSLGAILHELIAADREHANDSGDAQRVDGPQSEGALDLRHEAHGQARRDARGQARRDARGYLPHVAEGLIAICERALANHVAERFESAAALGRELASALGHRDSLCLTAAASARLAVFFARVDSATLGGATSDGAARDGAARDGARPKDSNERDPTRAAGVYMAFGECRAILTEALRQWPENPGALSTFAELVERLVRFELDAGAPRVARCLLLELRAEVPQLATVLDALERSLETTLTVDGARPKHEVARVEESPADDIDSVELNTAAATGVARVEESPTDITNSVEVNTAAATNEPDFRELRFRSGAFFAFGLACFVYLLWLGARWRSGQLEHAHEVVFGGFIPVGVGIAVFQRIKRNLLRTEGARALLGVLWALVASGVCLWGGAILAQLPLVLTMAVQLLLGAAACILGSVAGKRVEYAPAGLAFVFGFVVLLFCPGYPFEVFGVAVLLNELLILALDDRGAPATPSRRATPVRR